MRVEHIAKLLTMTWTYCPSSLFISCSSVRITACYRFCNFHSETLSTCVDSQAFCVKTILVLLNEFYFAMEVFINRPDVIHSMNCLLIWSVILFVRINNNIVIFCLSINVALWRHRDENCCEANKKKKTWRVFPRFKLLIFHKSKKITMSTSSKVISHELWRDEVFCY